MSYYSKCNNNILFTLSKYENFYEILVIKYKQKPRATPSATNPFMHRISYCNSIISVWYK